MTSVLPSNPAAADVSAEAACVFVDVEVEVAGSSKNIVKVARASVFLVRETVIETAGLWYLRLGR